MDNKILKIEMTNFKNIEHKKISVLTTSFLQ